MTRLTFTFRVSVLLLFLFSTLVVRGVTAKRVSRPRALDPNHGLSPRHLSGSAFFRSTSNPDGSAVGVHDMECRRVHEFEDKCKFVRENCADEEVGYFDYLGLYYCRLGKFPAVSIVIMAGWLVMLFTTLGIAASDFFCINLSTIANILGMSESMAGVTFLAFGNGSPDVFSTFAAMKINSGSLAVGELIGAASFIAAVVAGSMAIVRPFKVGRKSFVRDVSFFIVAVLFGIFFLADGKIKTWECVVMVMFYGFYVCFVVAWHWTSQARRRRRRKERSAREHYAAPEEEALPDEDDEDGGVGETTGLLGEITHDFRALERGENEDEEEEEEEEEQEQQAYAELSNSMRLTRPTMERNMTPVTPHGIRPSLVGALEFRAVLSSLEKTKNLQGKPILLSRYSDDPFLGVNTSSTSAPGSMVVPGNFGDCRLSDDNPVADPSAGRARGLSLNDSAQANFNHEYFNRPQDDIPGVNITEPTPESSQLILLADDGALSSRVRTPDFLAPPSSSGYPRGPRYSPTHSEPTSPLNQASSNAVDSSSDSASQHFAESPRPPSSLSASPPPSIRLPPPSIDTVSLATLSAGENWKVLKYWPYHIIPPPKILLGTLFPTLRGFKGKSLMEKCLGFIALPSVFLLTITLPVVEGGSETKDMTPTVVLEPESPTSTVTGADMLSINGASNNAGHGVGPSDGIGPREWNRWLVAIQCITAPVFMVVIFLADDDDVRLLKPVLYALLGGLIALACLLAFTIPEKAPRWRYLLCFAGFVVAIGWISAIANEVVGVLKAFGVIFGISDAILGLTIFAIGNSLGDLVADITVARLGFPVMALSACFGGPMLNILLGIGISGLYMTTLSHSHKNADYYPIEVSSTLVISAATLLITLLLLLIAVPLNRWIMTRQIGFTLIGLWVVSTVINLAVELTGLGSKWGSYIAI